jgi:hypothetical protein
MIPLNLTKPGVKLAIGLGGALLVILLCLACSWASYRHGRTEEKALGDAKYATLRQEYADAWAKAKDKALAEYVAATFRADKAATDYLTARQRLADTRTLILKEIPHATAGLAACSFGPAFLRVYNQALGLGGPRVPEAAGPGGTAAGHAAPVAADAGLR